VTVYAEAAPTGRLKMRVVIAVLLLVVGTVQAATAPQAVDAPPFRLVSPDLVPGSPVGNSHVFNGFGCSGGNVSPALSWSNPPVGTKSYALMVYDPDAPTGSGWWHWVVWNIPANAKSCWPGQIRRPACRLPARRRAARLWRRVTAARPPVGDKPRAITSACAL
jgi:phosphatidylethanolamine-binding protein (PEBP) family uncharacterized protein